MFPRPIQETSRRRQIIYKVALPISLIIWLLPMIAIVATAGRSLSDLNSGNYWGIPSEWAFVDNFNAVFGSSSVGIYLLNSVIITLPSIVGALFLSTLAGAGLALYKFRGRFVILALFIAGNFVPFQILMIPVRQLTLDLGIYDTYWGVILFQIAFQTGFCTFFMRNFIADLPFRTGRGGAGRRRGRMEDPDPRHRAAGPSGAGGAWRCYSSPSSGTISSGPSSLSSLTIFVRSRWV